METFTKARPLVPSPKYVSNRRTALVGLKAEITKGSIDEPTIRVVQQFASLPWCYTLQSCHGHFMKEPRVEDRNARRVVEIGSAGAGLHYRIAYVAFCVQKSRKGVALLDRMSEIANLDSNYIQFGSADWFWQRCVNSYVLQVSPLEHACEDSFDIDFDEALRIEQTRDRFFTRLQDVLSRMASSLG